MSNKYILQTNAKQEDISRLLANSGFRHSVVTIEDGAHLIRGRESVYIPDAVTGALMAHQCEIIDFARLRRSVCPKCQAEVNPSKSRCDACGMHWNGFMVWFEKNEDKPEQPTSPIQTEIAYRRAGELKRDNAGLKMILSELQGMLSTIQFITEQEEPDFARIKEITDRYSYLCIWLEHHQIEP